jgi:hypothetical protein
VTCAGAIPTRSRAARAGMWSVTRNASATVPEEQPASTRTTASASSQLRRSQK